MSGKTLSAVAVSPGHMELQAFDLPEITDDDGLLRVEMCGVCGSDPRIYAWGTYDWPLILGHEVVGHIAEIGALAATRWGVRAGDRVVVEHRFGCGHCPMCLIGEYRFCRERGGYGFMKIDRPPHLWGGYGQHMYLTPNARVHPISEDVPAEAAAMTCANVANGIRWVRTVGGATIGDDVVVIGPGGQGLAAVLAAHQAGANQIIAIGLSADAHRFEVARLFGATHVIDLEQEDPLEVVLELTHGKLADVVVDVAGAPASVPLALELVRPKGTVIAGSNPGSKLASFAPSVLPLKEIRYLGVNSHDTPAVRAAIKVVESRRYPIERMVTHRFSLDEADRAVRTAGGEIPVEGFIKGAIVPN